MERASNGAPKPRHPSKKIYLDYDNPMDTARKLACSWRCPRFRFTKGEFFFELRKEQWRLVDRRDVECLVWEFLDHCYVSHDRTGERYPEPCRFDPLPSDVDAVTAAFAAVCFAPDWDAQILRDAA